MEYRFLNNKTFQDLFLNAKPHWLLLLISASFSFAAHLLPELEGEAECECFPDSSQGAVESHLFIFHPDNFQKSFLDIVCVGEQNDTVGKGENLKSEFR